METLFILAAKIPITKEFITTDGIGQASTAEVFHAHHSPFFRKLTVYRGHREKVRNIGICVLFCNDTDNLLHRNLYDTQISFTSNIVCIENGLQERKRCFFYICRILACNTLFLILIYRTPFPCFFLKTNNSSSYSGF